MTRLERYILIDAIALLVATAVLLVSAPVWVIASLVFLAAGTSLRGHLREHWGRQR